VGGALGRLRCRSGIIHGGTPTPGRHLEQNVC
jgi:hypothetical protein